MLMKSIDRMLVYAYVFRWQSRKVYLREEQGMNSCCFHGTGKVSRPTLSLAVEGQLLLDGAVISVQPTGSKPSPKCKPKYVAYNLAIKCCKKGCPSWIWIQRTMLLEKCQMCSTPWWKSYHKNGVHVRQ